jgi:ABC-type transport system involved in multi-copper enzyme maturation permease subunit
MTFLPIIERELLVSARHPFTYHLRTLGVAALLLASLLFGHNHGFMSNRGGALFGSLHFTLFLAIWVLVPLLTADCISRERREGTLGLLFLTQLKGSGIVVAKGLVHGLRALTLWVAVLPVLTIPFLLGGVGWHEAVLSVLVNFSAICWALAAGLLASAWSKSWSRALLRAAVLALFFLLALGTVAGTFLLPAFTRRGLAGGSASWLFALLTGLGFVGNSMGVWRLAPGTQLLWATGKVAVFSLLVLAAATVVAGVKTQRVWQEEPPSQRQLWWEATFCTPILWVAFFRRWMRWKLEHNPIGWLGQRTWSGRLVTWGWFAVIISLYSAVLTDRDFFRNYSDMQRTIAWLLAFTIGMSAAASFQRERETGVLELLLVSPLGESAIIWGRLRGLWSQFLPAVGVLLGIWAYFTSLFQNSGDGQAILFHAVTFLTLPVIGLYFSLRCRNFISAFLSTLAVGLLLPLVLSLVLRFVWWLYSDSNSLYGWQVGPSASAALPQIVLAVLCWHRLRDRLKRRAFPLEESRQ